MAVDLEAITRTYEEVSQEDLRYASTERLVLTDVPAMIEEIESLRSEVSRLNKELTEHRAIVKHKQDFILGEPRGVHKP